MSTTVSADRKCVFFDRDGIVNVPPGPGYVERWEDFQLMPEFPDVLRKVQAMGYVVVIVTNQRGVARGIMTQAEVDRIHANLRMVLERDHGLQLLDIVCCPHEKDSCACRKPQPGMLLDAAERHGLDLGASWMIGDRESDIEAGRRAGCRTIRVSDDPGESLATVCVASMAVLASQMQDLLAG